MSASSKVRLSFSASPRQLHIPSIYSSHLIQMFVVFRVQPLALRWNRQISLYRCWAMNVQARLTSSLGPSLQPNMDNFIKTIELSLSITKAQTHLPSLHLHPIYILCIVWIIDFIKKYILI